MGHLTNQIPTIISCIILANLALSGFPFLAGFYSKDIIIECTITSTFNIVITSITIIRLGLTAFYSIRATMVGTITPKLTTPFIISTEPAPIIKPVIYLSIMATVIGRVVS
jgi:NADH-ubiquinone oxidoreductase chain 5